MAPASAAAAAALAVDDGGERVDSEGAGAAAAGSVVKSEGVKRAVPSREQLSKTVRRSAPL